MEPDPAIRPKLKVLVCDDEHAITDTLELIFIRHGFDVMTAPNGRAAVEAARRWNPDFFLTDVVMPEMNGIEAAILVQEMHPRCKILLFSGKAVTSDLLHGARERGYHFEIHVKPVHPSELIARLERKEA